MSFRTVLPRKLPPSSSLVIGGNGESPPSCCSPLLPHLTGPPPRLASAAEHRSKFHGLADAEEDARCEAAAGYCPLHERNYM
ncbi:hypothetical protein E2562_025522 [Oryza meyeriana var. granulata]|uniref:Uncharacterized protein n=1 Tax=Oryza meyeriana var. granulata TaxID=110450 RepID=A0A6G1FC73_9ORYZ|nr:hypothetical protein E2562_025522 [Oryza meyeriana var. granulata]KAF0934432.1 hypothetical protein E2562_025522 [Oryza meyeriana var. granulata]KAF0934433.1 hypothetical protein E2562_025522 [Oryza meyeriana var. granulata]KAF0934434.1 hypothetical protein E2562_025522 [Oryza meyeriana var. granulata]